MPGSRSDSSQADPALASCIAIAKARSADLHRAERAYAALEKFLSMVHGVEPALPPPDEEEQAALLSLVRQEAVRRLMEVKEAVECLAAAKDEELARRRDEA